MSGSTSFAGSGNGTEINGSTAELRCGLGPGIPEFLGIPDAINQVQAAIAILTAMIGLPLNIYLLVIILKFKSLRHQRSFKLSLQIIVIEIVYHLVIPLTIFTSGVSGKWLYGDVICNITGMIHDAFAMFRFSMTLVLTIDRFLYIFGPFIYAKHGGFMVWGLSLLMWFLSLVRVIVPLYGVLDCFAYIPTFKTCTAFAGCSYPCEVFVAVSISFIVFTGVVLSLILYIIIFIKVRHISKEYLRNNSVLSLVNSLIIKRNIQQAYIHIQRKKKVMVTVFLLLISIAGGTTPAFTLYIISLFYREPDAVIFVTNMLIGRTFFNLIPVFDAIAFTRHGDVRLVSAKVWSWIKCKTFRKTMIVHTPSKSTINPSQ